MKRRFWIPVWRVLDPVTFHPLPIDQWEWIRSDLIEVPV